MMNIFQYIMQKFVNFGLPLPIESLMATHVCPAVLFPSSVMMPILLAMGASLFLIVFIYMMAKIFGFRNWELYAKSELVELFLTTLLILLVVYPIIKILCGVDITGDGNIFQTGKYYFYEVTVNAEIAGTVIQFFYTLFSAVAYTSITEAVFAGIRGGRPFEGIFSTIKPLFSNIALGVGLSISLNAAFTYLYEFVTYGFFKYLLPIGLVARAFTPTRKIGGTIIGLTLGMIIFIPLLFSIGHLVNKSLAPIYITRGGSVVINPSYYGVLGLLTTQVSSYGELVQALHDVLAKGHYDVRSPTDPNNPSEPNKTYGHIDEQLGNLSIMFKVVIALIFAVLVLVGPYIKMAVFGIFASMLFPVIMSIIAVAGVKFISGVFGQELDVTNLTRLI